MPFWRLLKVSACCYYSKLCQWQPLLPHKSLGFGAPVEQCGTNLLSGPMVLCNNELEEGPFVRNSDLVLREYPLEVYPLLIPKYGN